MLIDMTHTITPDIPVYPGDAVPVFSKAATITKDGCRTTGLALCSHTGTHMDAPAHLLRDGRTLAHVPVLRPGHGAGRIRSGTRDHRGIPPLPA